MTEIIGASQNFFRVDRKPQTPLRNPPSAMPEIIARIFQRPTRYIGLGRSAQKHSGSTEGMATDGEQPVGADVAASAEPPSRRVFLQLGELPGLALGVLRGEPAAQRRVLGARRGGRYGIAYALAAMLAAVPLQRLAPFLVAAGVATLAGWGVRRSRSGLELRAFARLSLWLVSPCLLFTSPARLSEPDSLAPALLGLVVGHALLWRNLSSGLG